MSMPITRLPVIKGTEKTLFLRAQTNMILLNISVPEFVANWAGETDQFPELGGVMHVYTSADLGVMKEVKGKLEDSEVLEQGLIIENLPEPNIRTLYLPEATQLTGSSSLVFSLLAKSRENGRPYLVACGSVMLNIPEEIRHSKMPLSRRIEFVNPHPSVPVSKGSAVVRIHSATWDVPTAIKKEPWMACGHHRDDYLRRMDDYIFRIMDMFYSKEDDRKYPHPAPRHGSGKFEPSHPGLRKIHCPFFQMDFGGFMLPSSSYASIMPRAEPDESYFVKLFDGALDLYEMKKSDFLKAVDRQMEEKTAMVHPEFKHALDVIGGACAMYAQGQAYVPDHANTYDPSSGTSFDPKKHIVFDEDMQNLRVTNGDDCEDMGQDGLITARTIRGFYETPWKAPVLKAAQQVLGGFLLLMPHGAVSMAAADECKEAPDAENIQFMAHIFCLMIPHGRALKMLRRGGSDPASIGVPLQAPAWSERLDLVFVEGTGRVSPIFRPEWEWQNKDMSWFTETVQGQIAFEKENPRFAGYNIMQVPR